MHNWSHGVIVNFLVNNTSFLFMFCTIMYILIATIVDTLTEDVNTETLTTTTLVRIYGTVELEGFAESRDEVVDKFSQTTTR